MTDAAAIARVAVAFSRLARAADQVCSSLLDWANSDADNPTVSEPAVPPAEPKPAAEHVAPWRRKTKERVALLLELWHRGDLSKDEIHRRINELPGEEIPRNQLTSYAAQWGITRPRRFSGRATPSFPPPDTSLNPPPIDYADDGERCPITARDALTWARRNKPEGFNDPRTLADVNAIRIHHGLPRYRIIRDYEPPSPLLDPSSFPQPQAGAN